MVLVIKNRDERLALTVKDFPLNRRIPTLISAICWRHFKNLSLLLKEKNRVTFKILAYTLDANRKSIEQLFDHETTGFMPDSLYCILRVGTQRIH
jgi:hypothetical protein